MLIKKLDVYILRKFLLLFVGAFFICLFVFMMQFTWRYVDELIGKGLSLEVLVKFFWYMALTLVPQALPLSLLLASLITFGNMGEQLEILSMKAAGIPLIRIMRPLIWVAVLVCGVSFYFQNHTSPHAQVNLRTLLLSMKQQSPAVEIPEGVFYSEITDINIFVQQKDAETGMLYQLIIYKTDQGFDRAQIVLADSGRLEMTEDKLHLRLALWHGEQFESLQSSAGAYMSKAGTSQPYDRETFFFKELLIDFDSNFNLLDKESLSGAASAKNLKQIAHSVDSASSRLDSVGLAYYADAQRLYLRKPKLSESDSTNLYAALKTQAPMFDSLLVRMRVEQQQRAIQAASNSVKSMRTDLEWKSLTTHDGDTFIRRHLVEWHQKFSLALACILFFFVGAPLGAIIRKGGLGLPTVISVIIFIFWYIINTSGMKMARDGSIAMWAGMWVSTAVLIPFGVFLTYKSNRDSVVFNIDAYLDAGRRLLGIRAKRNIGRKEVIIDEVRIELMPSAIAELKEACEAYMRSKQLWKAPGYIRIFFRHEEDTEVEAINERMEELIEELSNSRDAKILGVLNEFPILYTKAHVSPFHSVRLNRMAGIVFPLGLILWFRMWRFRLLLLRDLRIVVRTCERLGSLVEGLVLEGREASGSEALHMESRRRKEKRRRVLRWIVIAAFVAFAVLVVLSTR